MPNEAEFMFNAVVDDELYAELAELTGERIVHLVVWEDSMVDALADQAAAGGPPTFDMDIYLEGGVYFELYSVAVFPDPDADPWADRDDVERRLAELVRAGATLGEVAVDEDDALVLVLNQNNQPAAYLAVGGWVLEEWDELPV